MLTWLKPVACTWTRAYNATTRPSRGELTICTA
jgi:hypothetical protein